MTFRIRDISVLNYAQGFTSWHYKAQSPGEGLEPQYFDGAADMIAVGDLIIITGKHGAAMRVVTEINPHVVLAPLS